MNLEQYYKIAKNIAAQGLKKNHNNKTLALNYIRINYSKTILGKSCKVGKLTKNEISTLSTLSEDIKLSIDTMVKNLIHHTELILDDYLSIGYYIKNAEYILHSSDKNLIYFKTGDKIYQIVVKTTKDKKENFLTTFHKSSVQQLEKGLKRYGQIKR